ncbi:hypothetical protein GPALN_009795 [Globodera pallida]|nr:hypothetical protein GPALN_009795 [Globodera pallida]
MWELQFLQQILNKQLCSGHNNNKYRNRWSTVFAWGSLFSATPQCRGSCASLGQSGGVQPPFLAQQCGRVQPFLLPHQEGGGGIQQQQQQQHGGLPFQRGGQPQQNVGLQPRL